MKFLDFSKDSLGLSIIFLGIEKQENTLYVLILTCHANVVVHDINVLPSQHL